MTTIFWDIEMGPFAICIRNVLLSIERRMRQVAVLGLTVSAEEVS